MGNSIDEPDPKDIYMQMFVHIMIILLFVLVSTAVIYGVKALFDIQTEKPLAEACRGNPRLLWERECPDYKTCLEACIDKMKEEGG